MSTSLLDRVPYLSYCTDAVSVEIWHRIRDRKRHPCNNEQSESERLATCSFVPEQSRTALEDSRRCQGSRTFAQQPLSSAHFVEFRLSTGLNEVKVKVQKGNAQKRGHWKNWTFNHREHTDCNTSSEQLFVFSLHLHVAHKKMFSHPSAQDSNLGNFGEVAFFGKPPRDFLWTDFTVNPNEGNFWGSHTHTHTHTHTYCPHLFNALHCSGGCETWRWCLGVPCCIRR